MGTITGTSIGVRVRYVANDVSAVRWTDTELLLWINDAHRAIAALQPEASAVVTNFTLAAGTKQTLPAGAIAIGRINRNMGVGGATPAEAPRQTTQTLMDLYRPGWHADTSALVVKNWMKDERTPRIFYVYPPMTSATVVEIEYAVIPAALAAMTDTITIDDFYATAIIDYVLWRMFAKELEVPMQVQRASMHYANFQAALGGDKQGEMAEK